MKIILVSDSHLSSDTLDAVRKVYKNADCMIHCGDCLLPPAKMQGFITVAGNLDSARDFPMEETLAAGSFRILIKHGHDVISGNSPDYKALARYAQEHGFNTVFFGHTHVYCDRVISGVRLLNPGSLWKNRDDTPASLMEIELRGNQLTAQRISYIDVKLKAARM